MNALKEQYIQGGDGNWVADIDGVRSGVFIRLEVLSLAEFGTYLISTICARTNVVGTSMNLGFKMVLDVAAPIASQFYQGMERL